MKTHGLMLRRRQLKATATDGSLASPRPTYGTKSATDRPVVSLVYYYRSLRALMRHLRHVRCEANGSLGNTQPPYTHASV